MKKGPILLMCILTLVAFATWAPDVNASPDYYSDRGCAGCHGGAVGGFNDPGTGTCDGCHRHGVNGLKALTDKDLYAPGDPISVTVEGGSRGGWVRVILYDENMTELARSSGSRFPVTLSADAPTTPGLHAWFAAWFGNNNGAGHEEVLFSTNQFEVIAEAVCGNGIVEAGEECDDGNINNGDGCDADCFIEPSSSVDFDIAGFRVTKRVSLRRVKPIEIKLVAKNNGTISGAADVTIMRNGEPVFAESVIAQVGERVTIVFSADTLASADSLDVPGNIEWTATIYDEDTDIDQSTAITKIVP